MQAKNLLKNSLNSKPLFLLLVPVFFVLHGFVANYDSVPAGDALLLLAEYLVITLLIACIFWLVYRDIIKAALMTFFTMGFYLFFGGIQDFVKNHFPGTFFLRYRFIIPATLIIFFALFLWVKKRKQSLSTLSLYLNLLMLLLILIDAGLLIRKIPLTAKEKAFEPGAHGLTICDSCAKPDIFLIIPDQYPGNTELKDLFHFNNSAFEDELKRRGFAVQQRSNSNYNLTPFSVASTLNMDYLNLKEGPQNYGTVNYSYRIIRNNVVLKYLKTLGYLFYNCSIFDFDKQPAHKYQAFLPYGIKLITSQTFTSRLFEDFNSDILSGKFGAALQKKVAYENRHFNDGMIDLTRKIAGEQGHQPKFVYTHLMMPHYPYYYNSKSGPLPLETVIKQRTASASAYLEYLQYTNKRLLQLVDAILESSPSPPIIVLLGDHGFQWREGKFDRKYDFMNLNSVYLPNKDYRLFYDSMTSVNQFRVIFNSYFAQRLPLLKDSTTNVWD